MTAVDLFNTLENLKEEELAKFKWHLQQDVLEGFQPIKVSKLENAERQDTVDVMVSTYQLEGALTLAKKVLENIDRNDLVQSLPDTDSGPQDLAAASNVPEEDPVPNLEGTKCKEHNKPLEESKTNQSVSDHKPHDVVPLKEEYEGKKAELENTDAEIQQMIQKRRLKIQEIKHSVDLSEKDADREIAEGVQVFTSLKESAERGLNELINTIKEKQKTTEKQAEAFITELEQEISELMKRSTEVEQLSRSEDHPHLLQRVQSLNIQQPPLTKEWTEVSVLPSSYEGTVVKAVAQLEETLSKEMKKLREAELKRVQQYAVDVTLDPDTAHPALILSDDGKQVNAGDVRKNLPDNPERFDYCVFLLGKQSFSSGRFYFEVQVKRKTNWNLGVARESIDRKGDIKLSPNKGYWTIWLRNGNEYRALASPQVRLFLKSPPQKVGVFVDYDEGLVSFYDVDAAGLIYSFTGCSFNEKVFPYFGPCPNAGGKNSAPLIISPVRVN
ncbi:zinc finger protein RFP [Etheostoma spectabile]|uniref:zinc finger protein RFP n=1 Tax=Etheostoma spectabile TaxID=54343 RepID=UPI0013AF726E|nr:zinc finger protein RFP-like [Etheostoma spectabile]XP_032366430.1 zinc finger protein RFP-like [Etheostoma spectabile]